MTGDRIVEITFLVTALNEEDKIEATIETIKSVDRGPFDGFRIVIVDDGSTDRTAAIIERLASQDDRVLAVHNSVNLGLGGAYKRGLQHVKTDYVIWVSGDNAESATNLTYILSHAGQADIIVPVLRNPEGRPWLRRLTSATFTGVVNTVFGLSLGYYNGTVLHKTDVIRSIDIRTSSFAYQAEALIKLVKGGHSYVEVPYRSATYDGILSNAMRPKNLVAVGSAIVRLAWTERLCRVFPSPRAVVRPEKLALRDPNGGGRSSGV